MKYCLEGSNYVYGKKARQSTGMTKYECNKNDAKYQTSPQVGETCNMDRSWRLHKNRQCGIVKGKQAAGIEKKAETMRAGPTVRQKWKMWGKVWGEGQSALQIKQSHMIEWIFDPISVWLQSLRYFLNCFRVTWPVKWHDHILLRWPIFTFYMFLILIW